MNTARTTVAGRVQAAMEAAGETTYGLAKTSLVPRQTIDRKLAGATPGFNLDEIQAIADALGIDWVDLMCKDAA